MNYANRVIGIDPGKTGAMAVFRGAKFISVEDTPLIKPNAGKSKFDIESMFLFLNNQRRLAHNEGAEVLVCIEQQHAFPAQGGVGNFTSGLGYGLWLGLMRGLKIGALPVTAMKWREKIFDEGESQFINSQAKSHAEANKMRKAQSIVKARSIPGAAQYLMRKKDDGRAEAILIGLAAKRLNLNQRAIV